MDKSTDARIRRSHNAIVQAGRELLNWNSEATLTDIASHAGVGRATLYRLFETKEQLVKAIAVDCLEAFDKATAGLEAESGNAINTIQLLFKAVMPLAEEQQFLMNLDSFAFEDKELLTIMEKQQKEMIELVELAKTEGSIDINVPSEWIVEVVNALFYPVWVLRNEQRYDDEALTDLVFRTFLRGFGN